MTRARRARAEGPIGGRARGRRPPALGSTADARAARGARQPRREPARGVAHVRARGETAGRRRGGARGASRSDAGVARRRRRADARDHKFLTVHEARRTAMRLASRARRRGPREALRVCGPSARDARVALSCGAGSDARSPESTRVRILQTRLPAATERGFLFIMAGKMYFLKTKITHTRMLRKKRKMFLLFSVFASSDERVRERVPVRATTPDASPASKVRARPPLLIEHARRPPRRVLARARRSCFRSRRLPRAPRCAICAPKTKVASSNPSIARESPGAPRARRGTVRDARAVQTPKSARVPPPAIADDVR